MDDGDEVGGDHRKIYMGGLTADPHRACQVGSLVEAEAGMGGEGAKAGEGA